MEDIEKVENEEADTEVDIQVQGEREIVLLTREMHILSGQIYER